MHVFLTLILLLCTSVAGATSGAGVRLSGSGLAGVTGGGGGCTDGVDCLCDIASANRVFCEDYESADYYENTANDFAQSASGDSGFRGGGGRWQLDYGGPGAGWWSTGQPASPRIGSTCAYPVCAIKEYCSEQQGNIVDGLGRDCWNGNSGSVLDIQRVGDVDDEVSGLTLSLDHGGSQWLAYRIQPGSPAGILGRKEFPVGNHIEVGIRARIAYSTNLLTAAAPSSADFPTQPWKHTEFTDPTDAQFFMGNTGQSNGRPLSPALGTNSAADCAAIVAAYTPDVGDLNCNNDALRVESTFSRATQWPLGEWACIRAHVSGMGTSSAEWTIWFGDTVVFHATNIDWTKIVVPNADDITPNAYYNGNQEGGTASTETFYRYEDDVEVWKDQAPGTCAEIGL